MIMYTLLPFNIIQQKYKLQIFIFFALFSFSHPLSYPFSSSFFSCHDLGLLAPGKALRDGHGTWPGFSQTQKQCPNFPKLAWFSLAGYFGRLEVISCNSLH